MTYNEWINQWFVSDEDDRALIEEVFDGGSGDHPKLAKAIRAHTRQKNKADDRLLGSHRGD